MPKALTQQQVDQFHSDGYAAGIQVMPQEEGEIGSVATVAFQTSASARTMTTRPQLLLEHDGPRQVLVGEDTEFTSKSLRDLQIRTKLGVIVLAIAGFDAFGYAPYLSELSGYENDNAIRIG